jgi:hypothetical protein
VPTLAIDTPLNLKTNENMTSQSFTEQELADLIQGLAALIHRLNNKIKNDERHERGDFRRVAGRKQKIDRAKVLIDKIIGHGEEEVFNETRERRLHACS